MKSSTTNTAGVDLLDSRNPKLHEPKPTSIQSTFTEFWRPLPHRRPYTGKGEDPLENGAGKLSVCCIDSGRLSASEGKGERPKHC
jgi:hypothetical protein